MCTLAALSPSRWLLVETSPCERHGGVDAQSGSRLEGLSPAGLNEMIPQRRMCLDSPGFTREGVRLGVDGGDPRLDVDGLRSARPREEEANIVHPPIDWIGRESLSRSECGVEAPRWRGPRDR